MLKIWCLLPVVLCSRTAFANPAPVLRSDVEQRAAEMFAKADTNHDGWLTKNEYHAALTAIVEAKGGTPTAKGWATVDAQFDALDTDRGGRLSRSAFVGAALAQFDGADLNHDGMVTPGEAREAAKIKAKAANTKP